MAAIQDILSEICSCGKIDNESALAQVLLGQQNGYTPLPGPMA